MALKEVINKRTTTFKPSRPLISLRTHNVADYVIGATLVMSPYIFGFDNVVAGRNLFLVLGLGLIAYSLFTRYPISIAKIIPLGVHMTLDVIAGVLLILGPSVFAYGDALTEFQYALHIIFGLGAIGLVALTRPKTETSGSIERDLQDDLRTAA